MADYNRVQAFSAVAAIPAGFLALGITLLSSATGLFWWVGLLFTILAGVPLALLASSYWAGNRASQSAPILLANGTVAKITRGIPTPLIVVIVVIPLAVGSMVYYLSHSAVSDKIEPQVSTAKPHLTMIPSMGMLHNQPSVSVMFQNRGHDDLDKLALKIILRIDGTEIGDVTPKEVSILRPNTNRQMFVIIPGQMYDGVLTGKVTLNVMASAAYSFHGIPFTQTCLTQFDAKASFFDHIDC